jgi:hypothetical protein
LVLGLSHALLMIPIVMHAQLTALSCLTSANRFPKPYNRSSI